MKVKDLIRTPVTTCSTNTNVGQARDLMTIKKFSALPVVELEGEGVTLKGIVSFHDLVGIYDDGINIQQAMTATVKTIDSNASIREAADLMLDQRIHHLVVVDDGQIKGIISSFDFLRLVVNSAY